MIGPVSLVGMGAHLMGPDIPASGTARGQRPCLTTGDVSGSFGHRVRHAPGCRESGHVSGLG